MALLGFSNWTDEELVAECERLCRSMSEAKVLKPARDDAIDEVIKVRETLRARGADSLRKLLSLLSSDDPECRLEAAMTCEALDPERALAVLKELATAPGTRATYAGLNAWTHLLTTNPDFRNTVAAQMERAFGPLAKP